MASCLDGKDEKISEKERGKISETLVRNLTLLSERNEKRKNVCGRDQ